MREIKFRAWDTKKEIFVPQGEIIFSFYGETKMVVSPNCQEYIGDICHDYEDISRFIVMQYTGLKDKNGVEIYEGDIVKEPYYVDANNGFLLLEVVFDDGCFFGKVLNKKGFGLQTLTMYKEVIGSIYKNKELLND